MLLLLLLTPASGLETEHRQAVVRAQLTGPDSCTAGRVGGLIGVLNGRYENEKLPTTELCAYT